MEAAAPEERRALSFDELRSSSITSIVRIPHPHIAQAFLDIASIHACAKAHSLDTPLTHRDMDRGRERERERHTHTEIYEVMCMYIYMVCIFIIIFSVHMHLCTYVFLPKEVYMCVCCVHAYTRTNHLH